VKSIIITIFPGARINFTSMLADHIKDLLGKKPRTTTRKHCSKVKWGWCYNDLFDKFHDVFVCSIARTKCYVIKE
jgi:hypothetical protein